MAMYGKDFTITGVANITTFDSPGLISPRGEKRHVDSITVNLSGHAGNKIEVWLDREKRITVYDYSLDTSEASGTNMFKSVVKKAEIPVDLDVPEGATLNVAITCGATPKNVFGTYNYRIVS